MAHMKVTKKTKVTFKKSKMKSDGKGNYHCPTCGAFRGRIGKR